MRTPEQILRGVCESSNAPSYRDDVLKAIALAQAEAAREEMEAQCRSYCRWCDDAAHFAVARTPADNVEIVGQDVVGGTPRELYLRLNWYHPTSHALCDASFLRDSFARRHPEVKA